MATSKKRGKKAPGKAKAKAKVSKKAKSKVPQKNKAKAAKKTKKVPVKAKAKTTKKAKPKAPPKNKIKAPEKVKKAAVRIPEKEIVRAAPKPARASRGEAVVSDTTLDKLYIVNDSSNIVTLEIKVGGEGQTSDMTIKLDDEIITEGQPGDFNETGLGTNKELTGKKLSVVATITDMSGKTNLTSLTIHLKGGFSPATFLLSKEVEVQGGSADYLGLIEFFKPE